MKKYLGMNQRETDMSAEEMFKEMNFYKERTKPSIIAYEYHNIDKPWLDMYVTFMNKSVHVTNKSGCMAQAIDMKVLKAINKQCEELEWLQNEC